MRRRKSRRRKSWLNQLWILAVHKLKHALNGRLWKLYKCFKKDGARWQEYVMRFRNPFQ